MRNLLKILLITCCFSFSIYSVSNFFNLTGLHQLYPIIGQYFSKNFSLLKEGFFNKPKYCWIGLGGLCLWHIKSVRQINKKYQNFLNQQNEREAQIVNILDKQGNAISEQYTIIEDLRKTRILSPHVIKKLSDNYETLNYRMNKLEQKYKNLYPYNDTLDPIKQDNSNKPSRSILNHLCSFFSQPQPATSSASSELFSEQD